MQDLNIALSVPEKKYGKADEVSAAMNSNSSACEQCTGDMFGDDNCDRCKGKMFG